MYWLINCNLEWGRLSWIELVWFWRWKTHFGDCCQNSIKEQEGKISGAFPLRRFGYSLQRSSSPCCHQWWLLFSLEDFWSLFVLGVVFWLSMQILQHPAPSFWPACADCWAASADPLTLQCKPQVFCCVSFSFLMTTHMVYCCGFQTFACIIQISMHGQIFCTLLHLTLWLSF